MKAYFILPLLLFLLASCSKKNHVPVAMSVSVNGNGYNLKNWTTNNLTTYRSTSGLVYLIGTNKKTNERVTLRIGEYKGVPGTYGIYVTTIVADKNAAQYENTPYLIKADAGNIKISKIIDGGMEGTFVFYDGGTEVTGAFTAQQP